MPSERPTLHDAFSRELMLTARALRRRGDEALAVYGVSEATTWPLLHISREGGGLRPGALAAMLGIEGPSLVPVLDHFCATGLLVRRDDPADRRAKSLHLTKAGEALVAEVEAALARLREQILTEVTEADLEASLRVFRAVQAAIVHPSPGPETAA
jgi:MarR family transcriptional regulator for hemolysin